MGVVVGHFVWSDSSSVKLSPTSSRAFNPYRSEPRRSAPGGSGEEGVPAVACSAPAGATKAAPARKARAAKVKAAAPKAAPPQNGVRPVGSRAQSPARSTRRSSTSTHARRHEGGEAAGTGMVVTSSGEVLTNNHVIAGATRSPRPTSATAQTYTARVVGYDHRTDVAVLQLEALGPRDGAARRLQPASSVGAVVSRSATPAASAARPARPAADRRARPVDHRRDDERGTSEHSRA